MLASQEIALKIVKDAYEVAYDPANIAYAKSNYPLITEDNNGNPISKQAQIDVVKGEFEGQLASIKQAFEVKIVNTERSDSGAVQKGYFNVFDGLDKTLRDNMLTVNCKNNKLNVPAIIGWNKELSGTTEWIETECGVGPNRLTVTALARYFIKAKDQGTGNSNVANVMGVLVEKRYVTGSDYWYAGSRYTTAEIQKDAMPAFKESADKPSKNAFLVNNQDGRSTDMVGSSVGNTPRALRRVQAKADGWPTGVSLWNIPYYGGTNASAYVKNWIRYTDASGYSYVFYLASGGSSSQYLSLYCVSSDCTISDEPSAFTGNSTAISFMKGPQKFALRTSDVAKRSPAVVPPDNTFNPGGAIRPIEWYANGTEIYQ